MARLTDPDYNPMDDAPAEPDPNAPPDTFTLPGLLQMNGFGAAPPAAGPVAQPADTLARMTQTTSGAVAPPPDSLGRARHDSAAAMVRERIRQLKWAGVSKEETLQQLQREGLLDANGNLVVQGGAR